MTPHDYQSHDALERRRRQIEKAKAAHLSRQLQTRLQYARLKVDHGWQKQTLNEVENLYFHHYRARLPPRKTQKAERGTAATNAQADPAPTQQVVPPNVLLSSSQIPPPPAQQQQEEHIVPDSQSSTIIPTDEDGAYEMDIDYNPDVQESSPSTSSITAAGASARPPASSTITPPTPQSITTSHPLPPSLPAVPATTIQQSSKPRPPSPSQRPHSRSSSKAANTGALPFSNSKPTPIVPPPPTRKLPIPRLPSIAYATATQPRSRPRPPPPRPTFSPSASSSSVSTSALTYDSFWSSHSGVSPSASASTTASSSLSGYRTAQMSAPYPSLGRAGGAVSLASLPPGYAFMGTMSSSPFPISPPAVVREPTAVPVPAATATAGMHGGTGAG